MLAIPGIVALLVFVYIRPQEFYEPLQKVPFLYLFLMAAIFGWVIDLRLRLSRLDRTPHFWLVAAFAAWAVGTGFLRASGGGFMRELIQFAVSICIFLIVAHGVQTFRSFQMLAVTLWALALVLAGVGVHQGLQPYQCVMVEAGDTDRATGKPDGRPCLPEERRECELQSLEPGRDYVCEKVGFFGTLSVQGRVRYRGILQDPNELSMAISIALPFAFVFYERRRSLLRLLAVLGSVGLVLACVVFSKSRSGQLAFLAVTGAYFIRRFGIKGIVAGIILAAPVLALGGRSGSEAETSSKERYECWSEGLELWRTFPVTGAGLGQYTEYNWLTAHNSFVLPLAEMSLPGFFLFCAIAYVSFKIPVSALRRYHNRPEAAVAQAWAMALLASMTGMFVSGFFLSLTYHNVLWLYLGLSGALYMAIRRHDPGFKVRFGFLEGVAVVAAGLAFIGFLFVYLRLKGY